MATRTYGDLTVVGQRRFNVLGPLEVWDAQGRPVEVGSAKMRAVLTLLVADAGRTVSFDRIAQALWGDSPPPSATGTVQSHISNLRRLLEPDRSLIVSGPAGYRIDADPQMVDALRLPGLVSEGGRLIEAGDFAAAAALLDEGVGLWRGEPLADLGESAVAVAERVRLAELHLLARERRAAAWSRVNRSDEAVAELEALTAEHPLRERLWVRLAESLYLSGRQAEAIEACRVFTLTLREEMGLDPGAELQDLQQSLLRQDLSLPEARQQPAALSLVGRQSERSRLSAVMADSLSGNGSVVVLEGEAGIGKTRLAEAATIMATSQGWQAIWSRCADDAGAPSLWPWSQVVGALGGGPLSLSQGRDPDEQRFSLFQQLRHRLETASKKAPLLVVIDDIQAADATSLQLLGLLGRHLDGLRLLLVLTLRTPGDDLAPAVIECLATLAREPRSQRLALQGLGEGDVRELISAQIGAPAEGLAPKVWARTEGNPFFVVELVELLRSEHRLEAGLPLPPSVRDVLERRLAPLPADTLSLLRLAALAGRDVELALLQEASGLEAEQVIPLLEPAVAGRVLLEDPVDWHWRFNHALMQETLVAGLGRLPAARLHAQLAQALEARSDHRLIEVERLAHHFLHAVPITGTEPARRYATAAAVAARQRLAHTEAAAHTRRALTLLGSSQPAQRHDLLVALGDDLLRTGHLQEAQQVIADALAVARELGDHARLAEAASVWGGVTLWNWRAYGVVDEDLVAMLEQQITLAGDDDPVLRAKLLGTLGVELAYGGRRADGVAYAEQGVALARALGDPALLGRTLNNYGLVAWGSPDRVERRLSATDEALALSGHGLPSRTEFFARLHRGPMRLHLGDVDGFQADLSAAHRLGAGLTGPEVRTHLLYQEAGRAMLYGDWDEAEELALVANELYDATSLWGATATRAIHHFTFRRRDGRLGTMLDPLVGSGDLGLPLLQSLAVLAVAESGDLEGAHLLRERWPAATPEDWTSDVLMVVNAWLAIALKGDLATPYAELLPSAGRQIVVGTAVACWGPYDSVLADLALASGDRAAALAHLEDAVASGARIRSDYQQETARAAILRLRQTS